MIYRETIQSDIPFLWEMLYEAVYWRSIPTGKAPSPEEASASPDYRKILADWGEVPGDTGIIAVEDTKPAGAVWYRYWKDDNSIRGHISEDIPTLVLAVHRDYRRQGIGEKLISELLRTASGKSVSTISLMVSKDNPALRLYQKCGFHAYEDADDSLLMLYEL